MLVSSLVSSKHSCMTNQKIALHHNKDRAVAIILPSWATSTSMEYILIQNKPI